MTSDRIGACILCGKRVMDDGNFYQTGEGFAHEFCMEYKKVAR